VKYNVKHTKKTEESMPQRAELPFHTSSIIQNTQKQLRFTATRVTHTAICQFLWQRFHFVTVAIFVVFPYVISLCVVCVGYRKVCGLWKGQGILGVILSDVWPNMMTAASGSDGKKEKERQKGRLTITNSSRSNGTPSFPLSIAT
jgi:hypothetical protein